jgi:glutamyl-tRNA synthetase
LHIGGARTALFNWLLARRQQGTFVLRIEDTDRSRHVEDSLQKIMADLRWLGLDWDEGPEVGGDYGPYFQSERLDLYAQHCDQLVDQERAYFVFDTPEELAVQREAARAEKRTYHYPRPEVFPSREEADAARQAGRPVAVRFKMPEKDIHLSDVVLGDVTLPRAELEDFVILKADGFPTYHFACVVDDALMGITHVMRGSEHLNNTPKHVALQEALGFEPPVYVHVPIIFNMSGSKMSKRDKEKAIAKGETPPEIDVHDFRTAGYLPEAVINFISLMGWSVGEDREQIDIEETIALFDTSRLGKTNARFDREKLLAFNTDWAKRLPTERLHEGLRDYLALNAHAMQSASDATLDRVLEACAGFRTFADVVAKAGFIFVEDAAVQYDDKAVKKVLAKNDNAGFDMLAKLRDALAAVDDWAPAGLEAALTAIAEAEGVGFGKVAQPIRVAVSGSTVSPAIFDTLEMLGKDRTLTRMATAVLLR